MKAIYHLKASLLVLATMVACAEFEAIDEPQKSVDNGLLQKLSITGKNFNFEDITRSSVTIGETGASFAWDEDDIIGIFPDKGDQVSFAMEEGAGTQTATFSGGGWALKSSAKYAAYYPHVYENRDLTAIPVSYIGQTQNGNANTDHIGAYDFMAASVSTPENGAVAFDMQHLGSLVQLSITVDKPSTINKIALNSSTEFTETGTTDLTAETPAITAKTLSNTLEISLNNVATTKENEDVIIYFMTAPVDLTDSELTGTIHFDNGTTCDIEFTGKNLQAGKAYRLTSEVKILNDYIDEYGVNHGTGTVIDGVIWAPVNCGYHKTNFKYGKLYQWGRKYGQGYSGIYYDNSGVISEISDAITPTVVEQYVSLSDGQSIANENIFFRAEDDNYDHGDWLSASNNSLWNNGTENAPQKTLNDPCPKGWRVPTVTELTVLTKCAYYNKALEGHYFGESKEGATLFLPTAGCRSNDGDAYDRGYSGTYWSSSTEEDYRSYHLFFNLNAIYMSYYSRRAEGNSVRCVQE